MKILTGHRGIRNNGLVKLCGNNLQGRKQVFLVKELGHQVPRTLSARSHTATHGSVLHELFAQVVYLLLQSHLFRVASRNPGRLSRCIRFRVLTGICNEIGQEIGIRHQGIIRRSVNGWGGIEYRQ